MTSGRGRPMKVFSVNDLPLRIARKIIVEPMTGCWIWIGAHARGERGGGYGSVRFRGSARQSHRVVYEILVRRYKPLPPHRTLDHVRARGCATNLCCNPAHMQPVSQSENNRRSTCWHHMAFRQNHLPRDSREAA